MCVCVCVNHLRNEREIGRPGLTQVEVLAALGVIALLAALLLPAVQRARGRSHQLGCASHLRQIGAALHGYEGAHQRFPETAAPYLIQTTSAPSPVPGRSVHVALLPWLDLGSIAALVDPERIVFDVMPASFEQALVQNPGGALQPISETALFPLISTQIGVFRCPSDPSGFAGGNNYRANLGAFPKLVPPNRNGRVAFDASSNGSFMFGQSLRSSTFTDGLSTTVIFSERVCGDGDESEYYPFTDYAITDRPGPRTPREAVTRCGTIATNWTDHDSFLGQTWLQGGWRHTWYNHSLVPNAIIPDCGLGNGYTDGGSGAYSARSYHPSGVNALLADGSVRFVSSNVDRTTWRAMGTRAGGRLDPPEPIVSIP